MWQEGFYGEKKNYNKQVLQTKNWITMALIKLMEEKLYTRITIKYISILTNLDRRTLGIILLKSKFWMNI